MAETFIRRPKRAASKRLGWSKAREDRFFEVLAETGNALHASREVCYESASSAHGRRKTHPEFAHRWDAALIQAEQWLEQWMLVRALTAAKEGKVEGDLATAPVSFRDALAFLNRRNKWQTRLLSESLTADPDAARADLLKLIYAVKRSREEDESEEGWGEGA